MVIVFNAIFKHISVILWQYNTNIKLCQIQYLQFILHEVKSLSFVSKVIGPSCSLIGVPYRLYLCGRGIVFHCSHGVGSLVWFVGGTEQITKTEMIQLYNSKHTYMYLE